MGFVREIWGTGAWGGWWELSSTWREMGKFGGNMAVLGWFWETEGHLGADLGHFDMNSGWLWGVLGHGGGSEVLEGILGCSWGM